MLPKVLLLVCLVPLAMGSPEEMMMMFKKMMMMKKMMGGGDIGGEGGYGDMGDDKGGDMGGYGDMGDDKGDHKHHYAGDEDGCQSKEEAMKKKFAMFKKFHEMQEHKEMMEKKMAMKEKMEKFMKFKMFMETMHKKKEQEEMEQKKKMYEMWQKHEQMKKEHQKEEEFHELIESFTESKHKFAFQLTHHFLTLCKCGEINAQMNQMFMDHMPNNSTDFTDDMAEQSIMEAWASGDKAAVAEKLKKMSHEQQKKLYMASLIKSMCSGAKMFVMQAKQFEEQYMMSNNGMTTQIASPTTTVPVVSG